MFTTERKMRVRVVRDFAEVTSGAGANVVCLACIGSYCAVERTFRRNDFIDDNEVIYCCRCNQIVAY